MRACKNVDIYSALTEFHQGGIYTVPHLMWKRILFFLVVLSSGPPSSVVLRQKSKIYSNLEANNLVTQLIASYINLLFNKSMITLYIHVSEYCQNKCAHIFEAISWTLNFLNCILPNLLVTDVKNKGCHISATNCVIFGTVIFMSFKQIIMLNLLQTTLECAIS